MWTVSRLDRSSMTLWCDGDEVVVAAQPGLVVGDRLVLADSGAVEPLPRTGEVRRLAVDGTSTDQVLAANVDTVLAVEALPRVSLRRLERLLVLGWSSGGRPVAVLTKADLVEPQVLARTLAEVGEAAVGATVLACSAETGLGLDAVRDEIGPGTAVLLGPSGVGKSSLVNALAGDDLLDTGATRASDGKGRHTTTRRELVPLPGGGLVIDTPGLRAIGVTADAGAVDRAFDDVVSLAVDCRFSDCQHQVEPGCAVLAAVETGQLARRRWEQWHSLQREAAYQAARGDARLRQEQKRRFKQMSRGGREARRAKGMPG